LVEELESSITRGQAVGLDFISLRAGIAALEGRRPDAVAGYREALQRWRALGCTFDEALAVLDMAILLAPTEREMAEASGAIEAARETLVRLGATPLLARLDEGPGVASTASSGADAVEGAAPGDRRLKV
jgi:hypothetical protein